MVTQRLQHRSAAPPFAYRVSEEVVVHLGRASVYDPARGRLLTTGRAPAWTIAAIIDRWRADGGAWYAMRFRHRRDVHLCVVAESAIEGTA